MVTGSSALPVPAVVVMVIPEAEVTLFSSVSLATRLIGLDLRVNCKGLCMAPFPITFPDLGMTFLTSLVDLLPDVADIDPDLPNLNLRLDLDLFRAPDRDLDRDLHFDLDLRLRLLLETFLGSLSL